MRPGLLVSDRLSLTLVSVLIYRPCRSYHSRPVVLAVVPRIFRLTPLDHLCTCTVHSGVKKAHDWMLIIFLTSFAPLILDLRVTHEGFGNSSDPSLNGHLNYPNDIDRSLNEPVTDKIRKYRSDYNNNPPNTISFIPAIVSTSGRLHSDFVFLVFLQAHRKLTSFFELQEFNLQNPTVASSNTTVQCSPPRWNLNVEIFLLSLEHYGLFWILLWIWTTHL